MRPGLIDLPGEQQALAQAHFQVRVQAIRRPGQGDRRPPPLCRVLPGQQAVGGLRGGPGGLRGGLVAHARSALHGVVSQVGGLSPAGVAQGGEGPRVQLGPPGRGQLLLYRVPDQRVGEAEGARARVGRADQPGAHGRIEGRDRGRRADLKGGGQRRVLEFPTQDGRHLERVPAGWWERGETFPDHLTHAAQPSAGSRAVREQLDAFRDEQRVASSARMQVTSVDAVQACGGEPPRDAVLAQPGQVAPAAARARARLAITPAAREDAATSVSRQVTTIPIGAGQSVSLR